METQHVCVVCVCVCVVCVWVVVRACVWCVWCVCVCVCWVCGVVRVCVCVCGVRGVWCGVCGVWWCLFQCKYLFCSPYPWFNKSNGNTNMQVRGFSRPERSALRWIILWGRPWWNISQRHHPAFMISILIHSKSLLLHMLNNRWNLAEIWLTLKSSKIEMRFLLHGNRFVYVCDILLAENTN